MACKNNKYVKQLANFRHSKMYKGGTYGSLMIRMTVIPAIVPASFVACR